MNERLILILVIVMATIVTIAINEASALKDSNWFDSRDFYKKIDKIDTFDDYPYKDSKIVVKVIHVGDKKINRDFVVQYGKDTLVIEHKEFKKDRETKVSFYIDDSEKKKVCMMSFDDMYQKCKKFAYDGDTAKLTFYVQ